MTETAMEATAERFWNRLPALPAFPRDLQAVTALALPLDVVSLPTLTVHAINEWMTQRGGTFRSLCDNRALRGCIYAQGGNGVVFLEASDPPDEQRFTLAHEIAHFLLDYLLPRERALAFFGAAIRPVLDGKRVPTSHERWDAMLCAVPLGVFVNLMERNDTGRVARGAIWNAENRADRLALHLLAPLSAVLTHLPATPKETERASFTHHTHTVLEQNFGLPSPIAEEYTRWLWQHLHRPSSRDWLGTSATKIP